MLCDSQLEHFYCMDRHETVGKSIGQSVDWLFYLAVLNWIMFGLSVSGCFGVLWFGLVYSDMFYPTHICSGLLRLASSSSLVSRAYQVSLDLFELNSLCLSVLLQFTTFFCCGLPQLVLFCLLWLSCGLSPLQMAFVRLTLERLAWFASMTLVIYTLV